jgi:hypothetical protein
MMRNVAATTRAKSGHANKLTDNVPSVPGFVRDLSGFVRFVRFVKLTDNVPSVPGFRRFRRISAGFPAGFPADFHIRQISTSAKSSKRQPRRRNAAEPRIVALADEHLDISTLEQWLWNAAYPSLRRTRLLAASSCGT